MSSPSPPPCPVLLLFLVVVLGVIFRFLLYPWNWLRHPPPTSTHQPIHTEEKLDSLSMRPLRQTFFVFASPPPLPLNFLQYIPSSSPVCCMFAQQQPTSRSSWDNHEWLTVRYQFSLTHIRKMSLSSTGWFDHVTMLPTRKSLQRSSRQSDHAKTSRPS